MEISKYIQTIINSSINSLKKLLPVDVNIQSPSLLSEPYMQKEMGVLISLLGDLQGRIFIDSKMSTFSALGNQMFGMPLEGEMLESFTGEFGNMFAGNLCIQVSEHALDLDITPPTVLVGETQLNNFKKAIKLPAHIQNIGELNILFTIDNDF